jgi:hypothetical protein
MFGILTQYAVTEILDAEDKTYRSKQRDMSDKKTDVHEKTRGFAGFDLNALKQLDTYIKEMDKLEETR